MTPEYVKQLEEENEKLRNTLERVESCAGKLIRQNLYVIASGDAYYLVGQTEKTLITVEDLNELVKYDIRVKKEFKMPSMSIDEIVGVQPMVTYANVSNTTYTVNFDYIYAPRMGVKLTPEQAEAEVKKAQEHQQQAEQIRREQELVVSSGVA